MQDQFEHFLEIFNAVIAIATLYLGIRAVPKLTLALQRRATTVFLVAIIFFTLSEVLAVAGFFLDLKDIEFYRELIEAGFVSCVAIALYILSESERSEVAALRHSADIDALTRLHNHAYFRRALQRRFEQAKNYNLPLSIILLDIDNFKSYNDQFGHQAGNIVLSDVAQVLRDSVRAEDLIARYGGEEFVIVVPDTLKGAVDVAERTRVNVLNSCAPHDNNQLRRQITVSLGVATINSEIASLDELIEAADRQMYQAKSKGKNCVSADGL